MPPVKPENTGSPTAPRSMYRTTAMVLRLPPRRPVVRNTAKVCRVKGTVAGMDIHEQTAIRAANIAMNVMSVVVSVLVC